MDNKKLFGTSGIRGDASKLFTDQFCFDIGRSFALYLKSHRFSGDIAIASDPRESSPRIKKNIIAGLTHEGFLVFDQGVICVPAVNYILIASDKYSASIMVSGSHIKPHLNGIKFFVNDREILKADEAEIESIYFEQINKTGPFPLNERRLFIGHSAADDYKNYLTSYSTKNYPKWKVVVDAGNGAQSDIMPQVLTSLGVDVIEINCSLQGEFYSRDTEVERDFAKLQETVLKTKADFGIGYDSDGDRVIFVDEKGQYIPGDYTGALIAKHSKNPKVVTPINSSQVIDKLGLEVIRTKVGSPFVVAAMIKSGADFGYEANGGGIFSQMLSRDGGRTTVEILNLLSSQKMQISELIATLPKYYILRTKVDYNLDLKADIINLVKKEFNRGKIDETDGIKIFVDDNSWILFRSSANAPEFRIFVESDKLAKANLLINKGVDLVNRVIKK